MALGYLECATAAARAAAGDTSGAAEQLEAIATAGGYGDRSMLIFALLALGEILRVDGDGAGAAERAEEAADAARQLGTASREAAARLLQARLALGANGPLAAEALAQDALGTFVERGYVIEIPDALDVLAEVAVALAAHEEAARLIGAADAAREGFGGALRGPAREREIAAVAAAVKETLGSGAADAARAEGAALSIDDAVSWVRRTRGTRKRPPGGWESLTPTELRVVELAAEGLTNPQIGERLFITRGTVKVHLSHVYGKLGVRNRSELAAMAARRGPA
jgi:DNA-binding CsgD family transcriptional regulator